MTCGKTVSLLPAFAQPYRIVLNETIEAFAAGHIFHSDVEAWTIHLRRYWKRFCFWLPHLHPTFQGIGLSPPPADPSTCWEGLVTWAGSLSGTTMKLTREYQVTLFGRYRCHVPNRSESEY